MDTTSLLQAPPPARTWPRPPAGRGRAAHPVAPQHRPLRVLIGRCALLPAAALRDGRHLAEGHAGDPPRQHLLAAAARSPSSPGSRPGHSACTGLNCDGLSRGFLNSVKITVPSVIVSIAIASVNGYALANWRYKGAEIFFDLLVFGAFIPYQVMIYPLVIVLREIGLYGTLTGLVIVHTIFGMPILTLLFRNYFASHARGAVQGGARRRRRLLAHLSSRSCCRCRCRSSSSRSSCR